MKLPVQASAHRDVHWHVILILAMCLPTVVFRYAPMTDLPQHLAVTSILSHGNDPAFGLAAYYAIDLNHTLYLLPYALSTALAKLVGIDVTARLLALLSVAAYPCGVLALLSALGRRTSLVLLALPLAYNRAFFWGFINFNVSIGLALCCIALLCQTEPTRRSAWAATALAVAVALTHTHGTALLLAYGLLTFLLQPRWATLRRLAPLAPLGPAVGMWLVLARGAKGYGQGFSPPLATRIASFPQEVLGGYQDMTEVALLALMLLVVALIAHRSLPLNRARLRALPLVDRVFWLLSASNIVLYFVLPAHTATAKFIHFRHAFLALSLLPVLAAAPATAAAPGRVSRALLVLVGVGAIVNSWGHLFVFDCRGSRRIVIRGVGIPV